MSKEMWAVHVQGSDDMHACPDREVADALALLLNRQFARHTSVFMKAQVVPWPHSKEAWERESKLLCFEARRFESQSGLTRCDMDEDETW